MTDIFQQVIQDWSSFYLDPWFWSFPAATLFLSVGVFLGLALPVTWLAWAEPEWLKKYKIQDKAMPIAKYFWPSLGRLLVNNIVLAVLLVLSWPLLKLSGIHQGDMPAWYIVIAQLIFFVFLDDFLYYWMHRYFHENTWLMRHVHSVHHRVRNTCAINGNYMHWFEFSATAGLMLLGPILLESHIYVVYIWVIIRQYEAVDGHAGFDIPWNPAHWLPVYEGPVYHDYHHARFKGNYAGALPYLDRFMGNTYVKGYLEYRETRKQGYLPLEIAKQQNKESRTPRPVTKDKG